MPNATPVLAAAAMLALAGAASAAPVVADPNFNQTATTSPDYYGIVAWGADNLPPNPQYQGNSSFAGNVGFIPNNQWNNGIPGNGQLKVGFINNSPVATPGFISQVISGFTVGDSYVITLLANGRLGTGAAGLVISVDLPNIVLLGTGSFALSPPAVVYSSPIASADATTVSSTPFQTVTSSAFTATQSSLKVTLTNSGVQDSTVLLSGFALTDVTPVPEPVSLALLGAGLIGLAMIRRRG